MIEESTKPETEQTSVEDAIDAHLQRFKTLLLATLSVSELAPEPASASGPSGLETPVPELSYAPYSRDRQGRFYIFVSDLAAHSKNLEQHCECRLMFIRDERDSRNLFARERLSYRCQAELIKPSDPQFEPQLEQLEQHCGDVVTLLRSLPDFRLFRLSPTSGRYVVGFGKAYDIDPASGAVTAVGG